MNESNKIKMSLMTTDNFLQKIITCLYFLLHPIASVQPFQWSSSFSSCVRWIFKPVETNFLSKLYVKFLWIDKMTIGSVWKLGHTFAWCCNVFIKLTYWSTQCSFHICYYVRFLNLSTVFPLPSRLSDYVYQNSGNGQSFDFCLIGNFPNWLQ